MKLAFLFYPAQTKQSPITSNLIILHGLFGSSKNWKSISRSLSESTNVYALDLRNHGNSPHSEDHKISVMSEDLWEFIGDHDLQNVTVLGHSMGGLVSMYFDLTHPGFLMKLIIQDIAPRGYPFHYEKEIDSMLVNISDCQSRNEVDSLMKDKVPDIFIRQFLQMNLERSEEGKYFWKLNVENIRNSRKLFDNAFECLTPSNTKSLFIVGEKSEYINPSDSGLIGKFYQSTKIISIKEGGHYIHFTHMNEYLVGVFQFLTND